MIVLVHKNNKCIKAFHLDSKRDIELCELTLVDVFFDLALRFKDRFIIWCHADSEPYVFFEHFKNICIHKRVMASNNGQYDNFISPQIGYVDSSPFVNPKRGVNYPTWIMSSCVGVVHSEVLQAFNANMFRGESFDYILCSIAKRGQPQGLFCYSIPELLRDTFTRSDIKKASKFEMFKFIKQHYRTRWTFIMFFNCFVYEKTLYVFPFMRSLFVRKRTMKLDLSHIKLPTEHFGRHLKDYDVIIPTIGRKTYLYNVLQDLASQTCLPQNVIIIEQNPDFNSVSDLEYLLNETWPFKIKHQFIHQTGACNARNLALKEIESKFLFLADDDIRFRSHVMEDALRAMCSYNLKAATLSCLRKGEQEQLITAKQWFTFGSGCSFVISKMAKTIGFDTAFEFGFGEDSDFGMQLRNLGCDIVYLPFVQLLHLKAPIGGFRTVYKKKWSTDSIQPKPSPTVMLYNLKHQSIQQINGYKTLLFLKFYKRQKIKNPLSYFKNMEARWERSKYWAKQIMHKTE